MLAANTRAADPGNVNMRPGLWEMTTQVDGGVMPGMPKGMMIPAMTLRHCYTADDIRGNKALMEQSNCKLVSMQQTGDRATWVTECKGEQSMRMQGEGRFSGDAYELKSRMTFLSGQMKGQSMASSIRARRVGECRK